MLDGHLIHKAWIQALGTTPYTVDAMAKNNGVTYNAASQTLQMVFPNVDAALGCVCFNQDFEIQKNLKADTFVEFIAKPEPARLKDQLGYSDYIVPAYTSGSAIAFIKQEAGHLPLKLVSPETTLSSDNLVSISEGGLASTSPNIHGRKVQIRNLPIIFPEAIYQLNQPLNKARIFLITTTKKGAFKLLTIENPKLITTTQANDSERIITAEIDVNSIEEKGFNFD